MGDGTWAWVVAPGHGWWDLGMGDGICVLVALAL